MGGSSDAELKELTVAPTRSPFGPHAVTIVTPVANWPRALRKTRGSMTESATSDVQGLVREAKADGSQVTSIRVWIVGDMRPCTVYVEERLLDHVPSIQCLGTAEFHQFVYGLHAPADGRCGRCT